MKKSKDDEFLLVTIPTIIGNNFIGYQHTITKIRRALKRLPKDFFDMVIARNSENYIVESSDRIKFLIAKGSPDYGRFVRSFENIAAGLFFYEFEEIFVGKINMYLAFINYADPNINTYVSFLKERFNLEAGHLPPKGQNPEIFKYIFSPVVENNLRCLKITFYEGVEVLIAFIPKSTPTPKPLAVELLHRGIPTIITLGEKEYTFNVNKDG